jgi:hypothetical protein
MTPDAFSTAGTRFERKVIGSSGSGRDVRDHSALGQCDLGRRFTRAVVRNSVKLAVAGRSFSIVVL